MSIYNVIILFKWMLSKLHPLSSNSLPNTFTANWKGAYILQIPALISKASVSDPFLSFILFLAMENKANAILKKMRPLKWERKNSSNGEFQLNAVFRQNRLLYMRLIELEGGLELFWQPNRSVVCSVHGWMTDQTHSIHFGVMWFFYPIDC